MFVTKVAKSSVVGATCREIAGIQHGVVGRWQLRRAGIPNTSIDRHIDSTLFRLFPGVYAVGRRQITQDGLWMAGVLCAGEGAVIGHGSAAALWGVLRTTPSVEVLRSRHRWRGRAQVDLEGAESSVTLIVRRTRNLPENDIAEIRGIPVTSVARTLLNLAAVLPEPGLKRAFMEADRLGLLNDRDLIDCAGRATGHRGAAKYRRLFALRNPEAQGLRSLLEVMFLNLCREEGIERPETNVLIGTYEVDCVWRSRRLIVELDGYEFHRGLEKLEGDNSRTNQLQFEGWTVLRFTWRMVTAKPEMVVRQVRHALGSRVPEA